MIFPELKNKKFGQVNLNLEGELWLKKNRKKYLNISNPLLTPSICQEMVDRINQKNSIDYSFGGWMENRNIFLKGTYLDKYEKYLHLGVDINVPHGTSVACDLPAKVIRIDDDYPEESGWGPRVIVRLLNIPTILIYAHLDKDIICKVGDVLKSGQVFAKIGSSSHNGGWFPHLHIQSVEPKYYDNLLKIDIRDLDGYGLPSEKETLSIIFKDQMKFIILIS